MKHVVMLAALVVTTAAARASPGQVPARRDTTVGAQLLQAANAHIAAHHLDSAETLLRRVAEAPERPAAERAKAWVLLGVVGFYATGDSVAGFAFRQALVLDPGLQVALDRLDPAIAEIFAAERAASAARAPARGADAPPLHDCLSRCPEGARPPEFAYFPRIEFTATAAGINSSVGFRDRRMHTFLTFQAVIDADGTLEPETLVMTGGTARGTETELRRGLAQARFTPGRAGGVPARTRVTLRFDFEAEGVGWVKYTYRVVSR